ncbi:MAG: TolC family protein [Bacteroidia bacterium]|nr:TolC family protein [Bacteroidia bacterium]
MKKKLSLSASFLFLYIFISAQDKKLTLQQCIETGISNNLQVLQNDLQSQTAEVNLKQAKANRFPDLNGSVGHGINQGRSIDPFTNGYINQQLNYASYGISSGVTLFNGFAIQNNIRQNQLIFQASKMELQQAKDNLTINIILAYMQVLNNADLLTQSHDQWELSNKQVQRLELLNKEGAIAPSDLSDVKGQLANDKLSIINNQSALETSKVNLCQLMNVAYDKDLQLERIGTSSLAVKYEDVPDIIYQAALEKFALVKAVDLRRQSSVSAVKALRGQLFPTLSLNGNANSNYSNAARNDVFINTTDVTSQDYVVVNGNSVPVVKKQNNFNSQKINYGKQLNNNLFTSVSLNLRIPIFNSFQARSRVSIAKINLKNDELVAQTTRIQLKQTIDQAYINMESALDRYKTLLNQVDAFTESFHAAELRFNNGVGISIDYLTAKNNLDRSNTNLINAGFDFILRVKILDYYEGKSLW